MHTKMAGLNRRPQLRVPHVRQGRRNAVRLRGQRRLTHCVTFDGRVWRTPSAEYRCVVGERRCPREDCVEGASRSSFGGRRHSAARVRGDGRVGALAATRPTSNPASLRWATRQRGPANIGRESRALISAPACAFRARRAAASRSRPRARGRWARSSGAPAARRAGTPGRSRPRDGRADTRSRLRSPVPA